MVESELAAKVIGNRNQVGFGSLHDGAGAGAFKAKFGKNLDRHFNQSLAGSFTPVLAGGASKCAFGFTGLAIFVHISENRV